MFWSNTPFVYRIHEDPDIEKLDHFNEVVHNLGYVVRMGKEVHPKALQQIIERVKGKKEETVVSTLLLRSLKQARYSPRSEEHTSELQSRQYLVCRLLLEKKKNLHTHLHA